MRAIGITERGGPGVLRFVDVPEPVAGSRDLVVRVHAAGVNPVDWKIREGRLRDRLPHAFPLVPGWDAAGVVGGAAGGREGGDLGGGGDAAMRATEPDGGRGASRGRQPRRLLFQLQLRDPVALGLQFVLERQPLLVQRLDLLRDLVEPAAREKIAAEFKKIGYAYITVDLVGYRRGSANEVLVNIKS